MGVTIHYHGRISDKRLLPQLIEELAEISKVHGWEYRIFEPEFPLDSDSSSDTKQDGLLYGIWLVPPGSEPVSITFLRNGRMCGPLQLQNWGESTDETERRYLYMNFTKTQYAGVEIHIMIIGVFRYIAERYLSDFGLSDEGEYWETGDEELLKGNFSRNKAMIDGFAGALRETTRGKGESMDAYLERIIREFKERNDSAISNP